MGRWTGCCCILGRQTEAGYEVTEVWRSKEAFDRFAADTLGPVLTDLSGGDAPPPIMVQPFDLRGAPHPERAPRHLTHGGLMAGWGVG